jgi:hypothetical protein
MKGLWAVALGAILFGTPASGQIPQDGTRGQGLAVVETSSGPILSSSTSTEALVAETEIALEPERTLRLSPGIRMTRMEDHWSLATHDGRKIEIEAGKDRLALSSPVVARLTPRGWEFGGGMPYAGPRLAARPQPPEEVASDPRQSRSSPAQGKKKLRVRWLYEENPMVTDEIFNTPAIQQLVHLSPLGF